MKSEINWRDTLGWFRDKAGVWLASTTTFTFMWISVALSICVLFFWDATWSGHQAPEGPGMMLSFRAGGWVVRLWTIFALVGAVAMFKHKAYWLGGILIATWVATSVMSYGHALGFVATGQMERYAGGAVAEGKAEIKTTSLADRITAIEKLKQETRDDLALKVTPLNEEITRLDTDGKVNEELGNVQKARRAELEDAAQKKIDAYDAQILALNTKGETDQLEGNEEVATAVKFDPLYLWIGGWAHGSSPTDDQLRGIAQKIGAYWALLIELIGGAGPAILYAAHAHFADRSDVRRKEGHDASIPDGMVDLRMTEEEWADYQAAMSVHSNIKDGAQKGARTRRRGKKIKEGAEYSRDLVERFVDRRRKGETMENILQTRGLSLGEFMATYDKYIRDDDERELLLGEFDEAFEYEPEPEFEDDPEQMTNGADHDDHEPEGADDESDRAIS